MTENKNYEKRRGRLGIAEKLPPKDLTPVRNNNICLRYAGPNVPRVGPDEYLRQNNTKTALRLYYLPTYVALLYRCLMAIRNRPRDSESGTFCFILPAHIGSNWHQLETQDFEVSSVSLPIT